MLYFVKGTAYEEALWKMNVMNAYFESSMHSYDIFQIVLDIFWKRVIYLFFMYSFIHLFFVCVNM